MSEAAPAGSFQPVSEVKMMRLGRIIQDLRTKVPLSAEAPGEQTVIPKTEEVDIPPPLKGPPLIVSFYL